MSAQVINNPEKDEDLPEKTRTRIKMFVDSGVPREHLVIGENGDVFVDEETVMYELQMKRMYPDRPRSEYMSVVYPSKIVVSQD